MGGRVYTKYILYYTILYYIILNILYYLYFINNIVYNIVYYIVIYHIVIGGGGGVNLGCENKKYLASHNYILLHAVLILGPADIWRWEGCIVGIHPTKSRALPIKWRGDSLCVRVAQVSYC
jgi:hypothetical protein